MVMSKRFASAYLDQPVQEKAVLSALVSAWYSKPTKVLPHPAQQEAKAPLSLRTTYPACSSVWSTLEASSTSAPMKPRNFLIFFTDESSKATTFDEEKMNLAAP